MKYPSIPLVGGPFNGQRRPIVDGHIPERVERLPSAGEKIEVYEHRRNLNGTDEFVYLGRRKIMHKEIETR